MNAFEVLGLPDRLLIADEELREAFRQAGKKLHPDAGGSETEFASAKEAKAILESPSRRLRHWLELRGCQVESRGIIGASLMDLFGEIGKISQQAEAVIHQREQARSALMRAMLESKTQECREQVEAGIATVERAIQECLKGFERLESGETLDQDHASQLVRDLAFLEKWKLGLRSCYSRLV
ncbi:DnaJ domain-containing protein [Luteolibacter pohnpeiensis]|uniref:DnaJ domain-containing protein n=1 Tax=Luteolibacter pohnpeiensis TaxID=454153 RepID=A0A934VRJ6_9BACT|nr:DnaJ domain-containing protein [Luteolibacter pohnpeiensis]MBK1883281.1 DnaJ domain-containing protein [Luteolibacter pohnpeiensis]